MRCSVSVANVRRVLCVFPVYSPAFGTFSHAYELMRDVRGFMPPQGLLLIAAYLPERWQVRFIDENIAPASAADFQWADVVLVSGMHIQAPQIRDIHRRAKAAGKVMALGGPSASASPELYPDVDFLHIGELGDGTDALIATLNHSVARPVSQVRFTTRERLPLTEFPIPAYHLAALSRYAMCTLQFSSGCPYLCEFCDIPGLYGRQPRFKSAKQVLAELDAMCRQTDYPPVVYFVDDNFIGNRRAARDMLPHLIDWQRRHAYPMRFACEATLNIAKQTEILGLMRDAAFIGIFCGIETPEADALKAMRKDQNNALPMVDAVRTLNRYGLEVTSGIILGLDTDSADTEAHLKEFIELTQIPMLTVNLLTALPKTLLWDRLRKAGRLVDDPQRESNVVFRRPYDEVMAMYRRSISYANTPERLFARFYHQIDATYANRIPETRRGRLTWSNLRNAAVMMFNIVVKLGVKSDYRRAFWRTATHALRRGQVGELMALGFVAYHLIEFTRDALRGAQNASFYAVKQPTSPSEQQWQHEAASALRKSA